MTSPMVSKISDSHTRYVTRLGDTALILGQRLCELSGKAPMLEEEMALANFALDYIGQARLFYGYAAERLGDDCDEDTLAFLRDELQFQNYLLVEQPNGNFADTIARQFLFEQFYLAFLQQLTQSTDERLSAIAQKAEKEIRYHVKHASGWVVRLGDGTGLSHERMQTAIDNLWRYTGELFTVDETDSAAIESGVGPDVRRLAESWEHEVQSVLTSATLRAPDPTPMARGGKAGHHGESFGYLIAEMQSLPRTFPGARW